MRTIAIIQARMSSTRLPGKIMADIAGKPMLWHVISRARQAQTLDLVAVATSENAADNPVVTFCREARIPCFRGSEDDVLDRYYQAEKYFKADVIVRLTANCPLLDLAVIDRVVQIFQEGDYDYVSNTIEPTYPDGRDTEVFHRKALERAWREARLKSEREYVTPHIWKHPDLFRLANVKSDVDLSGLRWTVDEPQDLDFVCSVYSYLSQKLTFGMAETLHMLREHPELNTINAGFVRNE